MVTCNVNDWGRSGRSRCVHGMGYPYWGHIGLNPPEWYRCLVGVNHGYVCITQTGKTNSTAEDFYTAGVWNRF